MKNRRSDHGTCRSRQHLGGVALGALLLVPAFAVSAHEEWMEFGTEREIRVEMQEDMILDLHLPPGELSVEASEGNTLTARMELTCSNGSERCAKLAERLDFVVEESDSKVTIDTTERITEIGSSSEIRVWVHVPRTRRLNIEAAAGMLRIEEVEARSVDVNLKAGEVRLRDVRACPRVDLLAGEARVVVPEAMIASVSLDAGIGDVNLIRDGTSREGRRSWLVGSELRWDEGPGECDMWVDVQTGAATVKLTN